MLKMTQKGSQNKSAKPRLNLPFSPRKRDVGLWAYDHRLAILVSLACYVVVAVSFVTANIVIDNEGPQTDIVLDFSDLEALEEELRRAQELNDLLNEERNELSDISNRVSNEMGLDETLEDHRTDASSIYDEAERVQQRLRDNASDYNLGLAQEQEILKQKYEGEERPTYRVEGTVTVSYSLSNPVRHAVSLPVPAYMCEVGGKVVVNITVNRNGEIVDKRVDKALSSSNKCLQEAALGRAAHSLFNGDPSAPARQIGTITYQFIAQ